MMKQFQLKTWLKAISFSALTLFVASCAEDEGEGAPNFPASTTLSASQPDETANLTFNANYAWSLTADKTWCQFKSGSGVVASLDGQAGEQTVTVILTDDEWAFEDETATITMEMSATTQVVATVTRSAQGYTTVVLLGEEELNAENPLQIVWAADGSGIESATLTVTANYAWTLAEYPEWLVPATTSGAADEEVSVVCSFSETASDLSALEGVLVFKDGDATTRLSLAVSYAGYPLDKVLFTVPSGEDFCFDVAGTSWYTTATSETPTEGTIDVQIKANPEEYLYICYFSEDENGNLTVLATDDRWYEIASPSSDNDWTASISAKENMDPATRKGCIAILTGAVYSSTAIDENPANLLETNSTSGLVEIKADFAQYVPVSFTQEAAEVAEAPFTVVDADGTEYPVTILKDVAEGAYQSTKVCECVLDPVPSTQITITPTTDLKSLFANIDFKDARGTSTKWSGISQTSSWDYKNLVYFSKLADEGVNTSVPMQITYKDSTGEIYYVLVLKTSN